MLKKLRIPIALRLFFTVLLTTVIITTVSLGVFQWTMKENFAKYVADVEMQKLDHLIENLAGVYSIYHDWGNAIQAQILQIEGQPGPDDYDHLSRVWLRRQYDIAFQQRYFKENTILNVPTGVEQQTAIKKEGLSVDEIRLLQENLPSEYQPFEGLSFPLNSGPIFWNRKPIQQPRPPKDANTPLPEDTPPLKVKSALFPCLTNWG